MTIDQCLLMRTWSGMGLPPPFLMPKIRKLAKNLAYFELYCRGAFGELQRNFLRDVSPQGHKNFGI